MIVSKIIPFEIYCRSIGKRCSKEVIRINGSFTEKGSKKIITGDIFDAFVLSKCSLKDIYKTYLEWFNYTKTKYEKIRIFHSVKKIR